MHNAMDVINYFTQNQWTFKNLKPEKNCHFGNRKHLLNESNVTIPKARKRLQILAQELLPVITAQSKSCDFSSDNCLQYRR
jgi:hypothetical protein